MRFRAVEWYFRRMKRLVVAVAVVSVAGLLLSGCSPTLPVDGTATPTPHPSTVAASPSQAPTPEPEPAAPVYAQPTTCAELSGPDLEATFASRGIVLFNSSNGEGMFAGEPVNTHQQGGKPFGCLWGVPNADLNSLVLSAQGLSNQAHEGVISILDGGGFEKTVDGDVVTYTQLGDETGQPTGELTIHVLRPESWITGWAPIGGETSRSRMTEYLDAVATNLYK